MAANKGSPKKVETLAKGLGFEADILRGLLRPHLIYRELNH